MRWPASALAPRRVSSRRQPRGRPGCRRGGGTRRSRPGGPLGEGLELDGAIGVVVAEGGARGLAAARAGTRSGHGRDGTSACAQGRGPGTGSLVGRDTRQAPALSGHPDPEEGPRQAPCRGPPPSGRRRDGCRWPPPTPRPPAGQQVRRRRRVRTGRTRPRPPRPEDRRREGPRCSAPTTLAPQAALTALVRCSSASWRGQVLVAHRPRRRRLRSPTTTFGFPAGVGAAVGQASRPVATGQALDIGVPPPLWPTTLMQLPLWLGLGASRSGSRSSGAGAWSPTSACG